MSANPTASSRCTQSFAMFILHISPAGMGRAQVPQNPAYNNHLLGLMMLPLPSQQDQYGG